MTVFVAAGRTYTLRLSEPLFDGNGANFTLDWQYTPLPDCNEPNDSVMTANHVSLGDTIEGYGMAGAVAEVVPIAATQDWYWVTIPTSGALAVKVEQALPASFGITIWNDTGEVQLASLRNPATQVIAERGSRRATTPSRLRRAPSCLLASRLDRLVSACPKAPFTDSRSRSYQVQRISK